MKAEPGLTLCGKRIVQHCDRFFLLHALIVVFLDFFILIVVFLLLALIVKYFKSVNVDCITVMETPALAKQSGRLASVSLKVTISNP